MDSAPDHDKINDRWIFFLIYPAIALAVVHIGNENTLRELTRIPSYYTDLLLAFGSAFGVGIYFRRLFRWIDHRYDWNNSLQKRLLIHLGFGLIMPVLVITGFEMIYLSFIHIDLRDSSIFYLELPLIALFCLLINLTYLFLYHRAYSSSLMLNVEALTSRGAEPSFKENFVVQAGSLMINIPRQDVAYFAILAKHTFLITREAKRHLYHATLEELRKQVSPREFFQLNRQIIARRNSILLYRLTDTRRLLVELTPPMDKPVYVSKTRVLKFNTWLEQP